MAMKNPDYIKNRNANYYRLLAQKRTTVCVSSISSYPPSTSILGRLGLASRLGLAPPLGLGLASLAGAGKCFIRKPIENDER